MADDNFSDFSNNSNWTSIFSYYKGFNVKQAFPKDMTPEELKEKIEALIKAGFEPSWNAETNKVALDTDPKGTFLTEPKKYTCSECGSDAEFKEGVSKTSGKPWKAVFCKENKDHVKWIR